MLLRRFDFAPKMLYSDKNRTCCDVSVMASTTRQSANVYALLRMMPALPEVRQIVTGSDERNKAGAVELSPHACIRFTKQHADAALMKFPDDSFVGCAFKSRSKTNKSGSRNDDKTGQHCERIEVLNVTLKSLVFVSR
jgi:hypothetical protein